MASPMRGGVGPGGTPSSVNRTLMRPEEPRTFTFDRVFDDRATQSQVFEYVQPLVDAAVEGYNATIFTYGQTGSGKTHTMFGTEEHPGLIARAVKLIFDLIESRSDTVFVVKCTFVELHLDNFNNLLDHENHPSFKNKQLPNWRPKKIEIREDTRTGEVFLAGSDSLYTLVESMRHAREIIQAGLHLVDLAGSERLVRSVVEGQNKKEAQQINASLTALGDVLEVLSKPGKVASALVPYRNNKLTRLLQDSLGGNSKTCFIINVQTTAPNYRETLTSLNVNKDLFGASDIQSLTNEINHLKARLEERNSAYEAITEQQKSIGAENKELRQQIESLSRINKEEKATLTDHIGSIIHNKESLLVEQQHDYAVLQSKLDKRRKLSHDLKVKLAMVEGEVLEVKEKLKAAQMEAARLTTERDQSRKLADKLQRKLKKTLTLREEDRRAMQQRVLDLEKILEEESAYRRQMQREREEGRTASALAREYEEKVRLLLQQLERAKEDAGANEAKLQKELQSLRAQLESAHQKQSQTEEKLHREIRTLRSQTESQRMSIETFEATEREREKEVRRRASTKRPRASRPTGDSEVEEPEQRRHATHLFEEKLPAKKPTTTTMPSSSSSAVVTTAAPAITTASSSSSYASSTTSLKSKGSTLKSLFPRTAIPLDDDDDSATDTTIEATPVKKQKNAKNAKKAARKSVKGKGKAKAKKRSSEDMLSSDLRDNEDESAQNDDKENAVNLKAASASASSASASGGSQIKKRKLFTATTANKESQLSSAGTSLASSTVSIGAAKGKKVPIPVSSKSSLQRLLQSQKGQMPKLKVH
ncbi:kinesin motor domain containing protein [Acanthamoeba castellanii str. Neff]|uniref:Kinesin motor domain containing protein n=1 Tax=Acanthamoeba castellanii (strain ATCC 30010 / Neff) TaxID=1257118 RepID=L8HB32_ACACF|nr:kinesin motor domain containing protein [Acanthamoeba castellanii str. Neff]ELR22420.1 kinesin motor domain containing protein [Acanthamoeba castellanii str. Neff]